MYCVVLNGCADNLDNISSFNLKTYMVKFIILIYIFIKVKIKYKRSKQVNSAQDISKKNI